MFYGTGATHDALLSLRNAKVGLAAGTSRNKRRARVLRGRRNHKRQSYSVRFARLQNLAVHGPAVARYIASTFGSELARRPVSGTLVRRRRKLALHRPVANESTVVLTVVDAACSEPKTAVISEHHSVPATPEGRVMVFQIRHRGGGRGITSEGYPGHANRIPALASVQDSGAAIMSIPSRAQSVPTTRLKLLKLRRRLFLLRAPAVRWFHTVNATNNNASRVRIVGCRAATLSSARPKAAR